ncbi:MAG: glycosyltransferase family 4 protein [Actinomyces sp.]|nr:MAG: glycosyltransferase family 4 protein [Actinomyces sp.]
MTPGAAGAAGVAAAIVTAACLPPVIAWLRRRALLDQPNERSSHTDPTPRGGGIAVAIGMAAGTLAAVVAGDVDLVSSAGIGLSVGAVGAAAIGVIEDVFGVSPVGRLAAQSVVAGGVVVALWWRADLSGWLGHPVTVAAAIVWFVGLVNVVNFMDGINGITAVTVIVVGSYDIWLGWRSDEPLLIAGGAVAAGAALGFLPFNVPRARVFLGDSGSYLLGAWVAASSLVALVATRDPFVAGAPLTYYLCDAAITLVARLRSGEAVMTPHRAHAYQRRVQAGRSHPSVALEVGAVTVAAGAAGAVAELVPALEVTLAVVTLVATGAYVVQGRRTGEVT